MAASHDEEHHVRFNLHSSSEEDGDGNVPAGANNTTLMKEQALMELKTSNDKSVDKIRLIEGPHSPILLTENITTGSNANFQQKIRGYSTVPDSKPKTILKKGS